LYPSGFFYGHRQFEVILGLRSKLSCRLHVIPVKSLKLCPLLFSSISDNAPKKAAYIPSLIFALQVDCQISSATIPVALALENLSNVGKQSLKPAKEPDHFCNAAERSGHIIIPAFLTNRHFQDASGMLS
jgi:hypothetical protein